MTKHDYSHLSDEELKELIRKREAKLRALMTSEEFDDFVKNEEPKFDTTKLEQMTGKQKSGRVSTGYKPKKIRRSMTEVPDFLVIICKILYPFISLITYVFAIFGFIICLISVYNLWKTCSASGWQEIFKNKETLYIIFSVVGIKIISEIRFWIYRIKESV